MTEVKRNRKLDLYKADGLPLIGAFFPLKHIHQIKDMKLRKGDIALVTYPKCGTTWVSYMIRAIVNHSEEMASVNEMAQNVFPFLEMTGTGVMDTLEDPRTLKLHLPFRFLPFSPDAKYVIASRNPFDTCVSFFYFVHEFADVMGVTEDFSFDEFFECFMSGDVPFGDFFDFHNGWYEKRNEKNVLFLYYEDCKANPSESLKKLASFMGEEYSKKLRDPATMDSILKMTSFDYMKKHLGGAAFANPNTDDQNEAPAKHTTTAFFRKGQVGDWRTHFNESQKERLLERLQEAVTDEEFRHKLTPKNL